MSSHVHPTIATPINAIVKDCKGLLPGVYPISTTNGLCAQVYKTELALFTQLGPQQLVYLFAFYTLSSYTQSTWLISK